jgi:1-deoxy-D-xylulose 5-phosphate reductoisomerase
VALFLEGRITFVDIASAIDSALETLGDTASGSREALLAVDAEARRHVRRLFSC